MESVVQIISAIIMAAGLFLGLLTNKFRKPGAPTIPTFNPIHWFTPWNITEWFTPTGVKVYSIAHICLLFGFGLYVLTGGVPKIF